MSWFLLDRDILSLLEQGHPLVLQQVNSTSLFLRHSPSPDGILTRAEIWPMVRQLPLIQRGRKNSY